MKVPGRRERRGFTLVELMVVIAIIGILAGITVSVAMQVRRSMRIRRARANAQRMKQALEAYQVLMNFLPASAHGTYGAGYENDDVIAQLNGVMNRDPLLDLEAREKTAAGSFKDPWGEPFRLVIYKDPEDLIARYFEVYSCGENRKWQWGRDDGSVDDADDLGEGEGLKADDVRAKG